MDRESLTKLVVNSAKSMACKESDMATSRAEPSTSSSSHCLCSWPYARLASAREIQGFARARSARLEMLEMLVAW